MTNPDLTLLAVLVDRSGSMATCKAAAEAGLNGFIAEQAALPGVLDLGNDVLDLAIADFDNTYRMWRPMERVTGAVTYELEPRGRTALLDAMGRFITEIGQQLGAKPEDERPGKVYVLVVTDGMENASKKWDRAQIKALVNQQQEQWGWEFVFLGANMDAIAEGATIGVAQNSSMTYDASDEQSVMDSYAVASAGITRSRVLGSPVNFTDDERRKAMGQK